MLSTSARTECALSACEPIDKQQWQRTRHDLFNVHWATSMPILFHLRSARACVYTERRLCKQFFVRYLFSDRNFAVRFQIHWHGPTDVQRLLEIARRPTECPVRSTTAQRNHFESIGLHCPTTFAHQTVYDCVCETGRQLRQRPIQTGKGQRPAAEIQCNRTE